jgi:hypothetical protein
MAEEARHRHGVVFENYAPRCVLDGQVGPDAVMVDPGPMLPPSLM